MEICAYMLKLYTIECHVAQEEFGKDGNNELVDGCHLFNYNHWYLLDTVPSCIEMMSKSRSPSYLIILNGLQLQHHYNSYGSPVLVWTILDIVSIHASWREVFTPTE